MCGRYTVAMATQELWEEFDLSGEPPAELHASYNVAPSQNVPVIANDAPGELRFFRWGLIPPWAKDLKVGYKMINARAETIAERRSYRNAFLRRRCVLPADGFYEWKRDGKKKQPYWFHLPDGRPFGFAGIWERWRDPDGEPVFSVAIVTTKSEGVVTSVHDRMPVILPREARSGWLAPDARPAEVLNGLLTSTLARDLLAHPVSPIVNYPRNNVPACIEPYEP